MELLRNVLVELHVTNNTSKKPDIMIVLLFVNGFFMFV